MNILEQKQEQKLSSSPAPGVILNSRVFRRQKKREESAVVNQNQMFVTDYYEIVDKLDKLLNLEKDTQHISPFIL